MFVTNLLKLLVFFLRKFTKNSATAIPGVLLEDYFPNTLKKILSNFDQVILITGTNGKTTTTQMICHLLDQNSITYISNKSGSNLLRGIASSVLESTDFFGKPKSKFAVFEIEEGSMRRLVKFVSPKIIVVTNIFRDQLDAYGEIDKTYRYICEAIQNSNNPELILNADDPRVSKLKSETKGKVIEVALDPKYLEQVKIEKNDGLRMTNDELNKEKVSIDFIKINDDLSSDFEYKFLNKKYLGKTKVPGLHNVINAVYAQITILEVFGEKSNLNLEKFEPVFGRGETITIQQFDNSSIQQFQILLAKNPAGMNLNLHLLENIKDREAILILLNDNIADGKDVSWIWDVDFSLLKDLNFKNIYISGSRRFDLAIRLKYEGIEVINNEELIINRDQNKVSIIDNIPKSVEDLIKSNFQKIFVLPTYTAMLELRQELRKYTEVKEMWE